MAITHLSTKGREESCGLVRSFLFVLIWAHTLVEISAYLSKSSNNAFQILQVNSERVATKVAPLP